MGRNVITVFIPLGSRISLTSARSALLGLHYSTLECLTANLVDITEGREEQHLPQASSIAHRYPMPILPVTVFPRNLTFIL
jgi:hypothetical protein